MRDYILGLQVGYQLAVGFLADTASSVCARAVWFVLIKPNEAAPLHTLFYAGQKGGDPEFFLKNMNRKSGPVFRRTTKLDYC